jgi:SAM-dependent methyltransferase
VEELPLAAESFDVVVGFDAFQYAEHPVRALAQARRVARPGAHVVLGSWGSDQACAAAACLHALAPPRSGASGPHDDGEFETLALHAGLAPDAIVEVICPWSFPDLATALRALSSWRPVAAAARATGERQVRERLGFALARFRGAGTGYRMENRFRYLVASA